MSADPHIERSTPAFRQTVLALFAAGFSTFALMYCVQPLLPELADTFRISAAAASLAISVTTATLAATLVSGGAMFERFPRKSLIAWSLGVTAALTVVATAAPSWSVFLLVRALAGVAFAGLPAIAMAYIGEEMTRKAAGLAMGIYVAGTAVGGMSGRVVAAVLTDAYGWRVAIAAAGVLGLGAAVLVAAALPPARRTRPAMLPPGGLLGVYRTHLRDRQVRYLLAQGFLFMGVFVAVYNYLTFRLVRPPYELGHAAVGAVFLVYLVGMVSSPWAGAAAESWGRRRTLGLSLLMMLAGILLTLLAPLPGLIAGVALLTAGFFAAHAVTSTWIGTRAPEHKAQAASLYIVFYYAGASITGTVAGIFWTRYGWTGVAAAVLLQTGVALALLRSMDAD